MSENRFNSAMANSFEKYALAKNSTVCIFGSAEKGCIWSLMASDYLLLKSMEDERCKNIVTACFDRTDEDVCVTLGRNGNLSKHTCLDLNCEISPEEIVSIISGRFHILNAAEGDTVSSFNVLFIHSLSELWLRFGQHRALILLGQLGKIGYDILIVTVHETLHSRQLLNFIQQKFSVCAHISSNDGTLSGEVFAVMQTVRKSASSGKVSECVDWFSCQNGALVALATSHHKQGIKKTNVAGDIHDQEVVENKDGKVTPKDVLASVTTSSNKGLGCQTSADTATHVVASPASTGLQRLVVFDSTDPEFDEDSDPDNDLDL